MTNKNLKGIILAGGSGSRLLPLTLGISKQLIPVYDKPMIYYPLSVLMLLNIRNILFISTPHDIDDYKKLFGDGSKLGLNISYEVQDEPRGIAESLIIGNKFVGNDNICLILGDNIFYGANLIEQLTKGSSNLKRGFSTIFGAYVKNPKQFGVLDLDSDNNIISISEKPDKPKSNLVVSGIYFYTNNALEMANNLSYSKRNELEISDLNNLYIKKNKLKLEKLGHDIKWLDTGTFNSLIKASYFFNEIEKIEGKKVACVEEIAYRMNYINRNQFIKISNSMSNSSYGKYLKNIINNES